MKRIELYQELCDNFSSGFARKLASVLSKHARLSSRFYAEGFTRADSESFWLFLHPDKGAPTCLNPMCGYPAKFSNFLDGYADPFCGGKMCRSVWSLLEKPNDSPVYARPLTRLVRQMRDQHADDVNGSSRGMGFGFATRVFELDPTAFADIVKYLGPKFVPRELYDFLHPNARKTCINPICEAKVAFHGFRYARFCSNPGCVFRDPDFDRRRKALWLDRTCGKYSSSAQVPEIQKRTNATRIANELSRSGGTRTHHAQRADVKAKIIQKLNEANLKKSAGRYKWTSEFPWFGDRRAELELQRSGGLYTNVAQRPEVFEKARRNAFAYYDVDWKGKIWQLQGYEDVALRRLTTKYKVGSQDLLVPSRGIPFMNPVTGKFKHYFPDLILSDRLLIEIKSGWTGGQFGSEKLHTNTRIWQAIADEGQDLLVVFVGKVKGKRDEGPRGGVFTRFRLFSSTGKSSWMTSSNDLKKILRSSQMKAEDAAHRS